MKSKKNVQSPILKSLFLILVGFCVYIAALLSTPWVIAGVVMVQDSTFIGSIGLTRRIVGWVPITYAVSTLLFGFVTIAAGGYLAIRRPRSKNTESGCIKQCKPLRMWNMKTVARHAMFFPVVLLMVPFAVIAGFTKDLGRVVRWVMEKMRGPRC